MLLCCVARFLNLLGCLSDSRCDLFRFVLDLLVQALEDWENGAVKVLLGLKMRVCKGLLEQLVCLLLMHVDEVYSPRYSL